MVVHLTRATPSHHGWKAMLLLYALVWRRNNPRVRAYSCHSETHRTLTRIDMLLSSIDGLPIISGVRYLPRALSDHSPMEVILDFNVPIGRRQWRMKTQWLQEEYVTLKCKSAISHHWRENGTETTIHNQWEAFKATMRGVFTKETRDFSKALNSDMKHVELDAATAEQKYIQDPSPSTYQPWQDLMRQFRILLTEHNTKKQLQQTRSLFECGDKSGSLLAFLAKSIYAQTSVLQIRHPRGDLVRDSQDILNTFLEFYETLYQSQSRHTDQELSSYLENLNLPSLDSEDSATLEHPIAQVEIYDAISSFKPGKSTGLNSFPAEWYQLHRESLVPHLQNVFIAAEKEGLLPESMHEALIEVIPKPGKDPQECESHRPISLINSDVKILANILANKLQSVILKLINSDPTGFIPGRCIQMNLRRLYINLQIPHMNTGKRVIASFLPTC